MSIAKIKKRSTEHTAAIRSLSLSAEGRACAEKMITDIGALLSEAKTEAAKRGEGVALDMFYLGLVEVYRRAGWGHLNWRDKLLISSTASWRDVSSWRAVRASVAISRL